MRGNACLSLNVVCGWVVLCLNGPKFNIFFLLYSALLIRTICKQNLLNNISLFIWIFLLQRESMLGLFADKHTVHYFSDCPQKIQLHIEWRVS